MPWTRKQVRLLLSSASPLSEEQQSKMKSELHANPSLGHKKKGSAALKKGGAHESEDGPSGYNWRRGRYSGGKYSRDGL